MSVKQWFGVVLPFAMVGSAAGREPDVHVDLAASNAIPRFFAIPFVFEDGNLDCLEARWTMTVSNGLLHIRHLNLPPIEQAHIPHHALLDAQQHALGIDVRHLQRHDFRDP